MLNLSLQSLVGITPYYCCTKICYRSLLSSDAWCMLAVIKENIVFALLSKINKINKYLVTRKIIEQFFVYQLRMKNAQKGKKLSRML